MIMQNRFFNEQDILCGLLRGFRGSVRGVLRPAFQMAVDDDLLNKNPFGFELAGVVVSIDLCYSGDVSLVYHRIVEQAQT
jgi:hypothetical protein